MVTTYAAWLAPYVRTVCCHGRRTVLPYLGHLVVQTASAPCAPHHLAIKESRTGQRNTGGTVVGASGSSTGDNASKIAFRLISDWHMADECTCRRRMRSDSHGLHQRFFSLKNL